LKQRKDTRCLFLLLANGSACLVLIRQAQCRTIVLNRLAV
jgi:hypothetical protein